MELRRFFWFLRVLTEASPSQRRQPPRRPLLTAAAVAEVLSEDLEGAGELFVARLPAKVQRGPCPTVAGAMPRKPTQEVRGLEFVLNDGGPHYRWDKAEHERRRGERTERSSSQAKFEA